MNHIIPQGICNDMKFSHLGNLSKKRVIRDLDDTASMSDKEHTISRAAPKNFNASEK